MSADEIEEPEGAGQDRGGDWNGSLHRFERLAYFGPVDIDYRRKPMNHSIT